MECCELQEGCTSPLTWSTLGGVNTTLAVHMIYIRAKYVPNLRQYASVLCKQKSNISGPNFHFNAEGSRTLASITVQLCLAVLEQPTNPLRRLRL